MIRISTPTDFTGIPIIGVAPTPGKSAYEIWLEQGNTGSEADFIASLKGADGISPTTSVTKSNNTITLSTTDADNTEIVSWEIFNDSLNGGSLSGTAPILSIAPNTITKTQCTGGVTILPEIPASNFKVGHALLDIMFATSAIAGENLLIMDELTANKWNRCVVQFMDGQAKLYVWAVED